MPGLIIAWFDLRRVVRERQNLFWLFVAPCIFTVFFGVLLRPSPPRPLVITIVDEDRPAPLAGQLAAMLTADGVRAKLAERAPVDGFALVVPKGTAEALAEDKPVTLVLKAGAESASCSLPDG